MPAHSCAPSFALLAAALSCSVATHSAAAQGFAPAAAGAWTWNAIAGSQCMDGEETGVWIKYGPQGKAGTELGIYLSGGGACFNLETCLTAAHTAKPGAPASSGIWDTRRADNPFQNYSWIVVPYCTGDVHIGDRVARVEGALRHFRGKANLQLVMARAVATFSKTEVFVVTGESAGGFGAVSSYNLLRGFWPSMSTRGVLIDDSGPVLDDTALAPCLQALWRRTWDLNATLPRDCPCVGNQGNLVSVWKYARSHWPDDTFGPPLCLSVVCASGPVSLTLYLCCRSDQQPQRRHNLLLLCLR